MGAKTGFSSEGDKPRPSGKMAVPDKGRGGVGALAQFFVFYHDDRPHSFPAMTTSRREIYMNIPAARGPTETSFEVHGNVVFDQTCFAETHLMTGGAHTRLHSRVPNHGAATTALSPDPCRSHPARSHRSTTAF